MTWERLHGQGKLADSETPDARRQTQGRRGLRELGGDPRTPEPKGANAGGLRSVTRRRQTPDARRQQTEAITLGVLATRPDNAGFLGHTRRVTSTELEPVASGVWRLIGSRRRTFHAQLSVFGVWRLTVVGRTFPRSATSICVWRLIESRKAQTFPAQLEWRHLGFDARLTFSPQLPRPYASLRRRLGPEAPRFRPGRIRSHRSPGPESGATPDPKSWRSRHWTQASFDRGWVSSASCQPPVSTSTSTLAISRCSGPRRHRRCNARRPRCADRGIDPRLGLDRCLLRPSPRDPIGVEAVPGRQLDLADPFGGRHISVKPGHDQPGRKAMLEGQCLPVHAYGQQGLAPVEGSGGRETDGEVIDRASHQLIGPGLNARPGPADPSGAPLTSGRCRPEAPRPRWRRRTG